mmetsp:Transcript_29764/g.72485  ORF Transcript_29764/g.72485 Transcript_29764/m.72485 type:complete len:285 (+) Transcript_29764:422-1276(+)
MGVVQTRHVPRTPVRGSLRASLAGAHPRLQLHEAAGGSRDGAAAGRVFREYRQAAYGVRLDSSGAQGDVQGADGRRQGTPPGGHLSDRHRFHPDAWPRQSPRASRAFDQPQVVSRPVLRDDGSADSARRGGGASQPFHLELRGGELAGRGLPQAAVQLSLSAGGDVRGGRAGLQVHFAALAAHGGRIARPPRSALCRQPRRGHLPQDAAVGQPDARRPAPRQHTHLDERTQPSTHPSRCWDGGSAHPRGIIRLHRTAPRLRRRRWPPSSASGASVLRGTNLRHS